MRCKIAELTVEVPAAGDMLSRCRAYECDETNMEVAADIEIRTDLFRFNLWPTLSGKDAIYMETGRIFAMRLLEFNGMMLHASAVALNGRAYLFSAPSGTGKSTHTRLWQSVFGAQAQVFNDDKPALRFIDGTWYAYGTPWCGKDGININMCAPVAGICFLKQSPENRIRRLDQREAVQNIIWQTTRKFKTTEKLDLMLTQVGNLVRQIPVFELENRPEPEAALLSYETMRLAAEEIEDETET